MGIKRVSAYRRISLPFALSSTSRGFRQRRYFVSHGSCNLLLLLLPLRRPFSSFLPPQLRIVVELLYFSVHRRRSCGQFLAAGDTFWSSGQHTRTPRGHLPRLRTLLQRNDASFDSIKASLMCAFVTDLNTLRELLLPTDAV